MTYKIRGRLSPTGSLLGRGMRWWIEDERRADSLFIVALVLGGTALVLVHFLLAAAVGIPEDWALLFWGGQIGLFLLFLATCVIGFRPAVAITVENDRLEISRGNETKTIRSADIESVEEISCGDHHRHYSRYRRTRSFVNRPQPTYVLLHTRRGPVVLGIPEDRRESFVDAVTSARSPSAVHGVA